MARQTTYHQALNSKGEAPKATGEIHYNDGIYIQERTAAKPLSLEEDVEVAQFLNRNMGNATPEEKDMIQRFIYNYENMKHFKT